MSSMLLVISLIGALAVIAVLLFIISRLYKRHKTGKTGTMTLAADLRDEKLRSNIILNSIEDGVMLLDEAGVIQSCNPSASTITGWPVDEAVGMAWKNVIQLVDSKNEPYEEATNPFTKVFAAEQTIRDNNAFLVSRNKKQLPITLGLTPLRDEQKKIYAAVAVFRDITQERQEEKQRSDFISTASHEMRTPVAAIEGYLALAMNAKVSSVDSRARGYLEKAHASTQHLGKLFQDLLNSAKAEDGRLTSHPVIIEIGSFLEQLSTDLRFVAEKKGLQMEYTLGSNQVVDATESAQKVIKPLYYVKADPDRMREVVINIFDNAVKYTEAGKVSIGLTGDDRVVQFYVRDTGPGIPAEDVPHLFQKFYRVDNSATRTIGGTGLGLFICQKIVELYQGRLWVDSEVGKGSSFFINLPRITSAAAAEELAREASDTSLKPVTSLATSVLQ